ncbi:MAG TPA: cbb3-type cytochrome c oxidase subunit II [Verrucomicrobiae bacterium]|jgi:cbb3-type cytochrome oxidase cytochrome c subunit
MKYGPLVFLAAFLALSASWCGFVLTPQIQLGRAVQETNSVVTSEMYPQDRPGSARQGLEIYRAEGCAYCHSQQVEQKGTLVDVFLTDAGKNSMAVAAALTEQHLGTFSGPGLAAGLPKPVLRNASLDTAKALANLLKKAGANSQLRLVPFGPDIERGWGVRRTVAEDFIADSHVMPGSQRVGPDLANVGMRLPDVNWQLMHLFAPRSVTKDSPMPSYPFLFERKKIGKQPSPDALQQLPKEFAPAEGYEIVPRPEAKALAAYLVSLRADVPLYEAPATPPPAATNAPAVTNAPAK